MMLDNTIVDAERDRRIGGMRAEKQTDRRETS